MYLWRPGKWQKPVAQGSDGVGAVAYGIYYGRWRTCGCRVWLLFRRMVSYVPQDLPEYEGTVADIMQSLGRLQVNAHRKADRKDVDVAWAQLQLSSTLYLQPWKSLTAEQCRLVLLSAAYIHERPILLVDDPVQNVDVDHFLQAMAARGTEVVYTCAERSLGCQKVITLT